MGYMHIGNLYKDQRILLHKECYALEKIHGTSAHIGWNGAEVRYFSGGAKNETFRSIFDEAALIAKFIEIGVDDIAVYGEAYGGKMQGMRETYGADLKFVVFDVKINDSWLSVPKAHQIADTLGLEFVHWVKVSTELPALDAERDADSEQAKRNGCGDGKMREGVVLRPLEEMTTNNGKRVMAKHKRDEFKETKTKREVDPQKLIVLKEAMAIAEEWVTEMRMTHVLDKLGCTMEIENIRHVIGAMTEDIEREAAGEIEMSKAAMKQIGKATALMFKARLQNELRKNSG